MKVLFVHNFYQVAGGEDAVYKNEKALLECNGHQVIEYTVDNMSIKSLWDKVGMIFSTIFSISQYRKIKKVLIENKPDVVHVHNYFPLISPAVFYACKKMNIPVVHTLHNFRAVCPTALLMFDGEICEKSINESAWWAVKKKVYRDSIFGSFILTCMVELHKKIGTWQQQVNRYIALTDFTKRKYIQAGWPEDKLSIKSNFISDPYNGEAILDKKGGYAVYVGRLSDEKGIDLILNAWADVNIPIKIIGDGPLNSLVKNNTNTKIEYLGLQSKDEVLEYIKNADFIVMASTCYEGFPMVLVEALACGTCALVPKLGGMAEIIEDGTTGLYFEAANGEDLSIKASWLAANSNSTQLMGVNARRAYLTKYTAITNYQQLKDIYQQSINEVKGYA